MQTESDHKKLRWVMWFLASIFFALQFILRLLPGVMAEQIIYRFQIDALTFGLLSAFYYLGYAGMQIPIGLILDKFGTRFVTGISMVLTALGALSIIYTSHWKMALLGRMLQGIASATAMLVAVKIAKTYFTKKVQGQLIGYTVAIGLFGAVYGGAPMAALIEKFGYMDVVKISSYLTLAIGVLVLFLFRDLKEGKKIRDHSLLESFKMVLLNKRLVVISLMGGLMVAPLQGFADIWGIPYLVQIHGLSKTSASFATSLVFLGMGIGGPLLAAIAAKYNSYYRTLTFSGIIMAIALSLIIITSSNSVYYLILCCTFVLGLFSAYQVLVFSIVSDLVDEKLTGLAVASANSINMMFGFFFHAIMGYIINNSPEATSMASGAITYSEATYIKAFMPIIIGLLVSFLGFFIISPRKKRAER